jgi:hypothetical protein
MGYEHDPVERREQDFLVERGRARATIESMESPSADVGT